MGQFYHKLLTVLDACGAMYCWTLLNVSQPSYGWTRTLMVPDPEHGFMPVAPAISCVFSGPTPAAYAKA